MVTNRDLAALFENGASQAARLPNDLELQGKARWPEGYREMLARLGPPSDDFVAPPPLPATPGRDELLRDLGPDRRS